MRLRRWLVVCSVCGCGPSLPAADDELGEASTSDTRTSESETSSGESSSTSATSETSTSDTSESETSTGETSTSGDEECPTQLFGDTLITDATDLDTLACLVEAEFLVIEGSFTDLSFLSTLERVDDLVIRDTPLLIDLAGLDALQMVDELWVIDAPSMVDLAGLPSDVAIGQLHVVGDVSSLVSIAMPPDGARQLSFVAWQRPDLELLMSASPMPLGIEVASAPLLADLGAIAQCCLAQQAELSLVIRGTPLASHLEGLEPFTELAYFRLSDNPEVVSLAGLAGLTTVGELRFDDYCFPLGGAKLADLHGLEQLEQVDVLAVYAQGALASLDGLPTTVAVGEAVFSYNPMLAQGLIDAWVAAAMPSWTDGCDNLDGPACEGICPQ